MFGEIWKRLFAYLERQPYWSKLEPILLIGLLYVAALVLTYQYVQWQYHYAPSPVVFLRSYLFKQVTVVSLAIGLAVLALVAGTLRTPSAATATWKALLLKHVWLRVLGVVVVAVVAGFLWAVMAPHRTTDQITIKFHTNRGALSEIGFDTSALTYLLYELNRQQNVWHYEIDVEPLVPGVVSSAARTSCDGHWLPLLCLAGAWSDENGGGQIILITGESLGKLGQPHYFWSHEGKASLISAADWQAFKQPSVYEYLAYSVVQQTIRIHLDTQCRLLSELLEREVNERGGLFEFMTRRDLMRARLLSAQLGPDMEEKLFNCFGPEYAVDAKRLLSLDWLRSDSVRKNLQRAYSVDLSGGA